MTKDKCVEVAKEQFGQKLRRKRETEEKFFGNITEVLDEDFESTIATGVTVVIFGMAWCPHCQHDLELMTEVQERFTNSEVKLVLVNCAILSNLDLCFDQLFNGVPTINTFFNGKRAIKDFRTTTVERFEEMIQAHLKGPEGIHFWKIDEKARGSEEN